MAVYFCMPFYPSKPVLDGQIERQPETLAITFLFVSLFMPWGRREGEVLGGPRTETTADSIHCVAGRSTLEESRHSRTQKLNS